MSCVNIPKTSIDPFYRYKRTRLTTKITSRNILVGIMDIANEIGRDVAELVQYIQTNIARPIKVSKDQVVIPNLKKSTLQKDLDDIIENFIMRFIICITCQNPETTYIQIGKKIMTKCKSCGSINNLPQSKYLTGLLKNDHHTTPVIKA